MISSLTTLTTLICKTALKIISSLTTLRLPLNAHSVDADTDLADATDSADLADETDSTDSADSTDSTESADLVDSTDSVDSTGSLGYL